MTVACPICQRTAWLTADGLADHLEREHSHRFVAEQLAQLVVTTGGPARRPAPKCTKTRYPTEHAARTELVGCVIGRNRGKQQRRESRVYHCQRCQGWHLTSQPLAPGSSPERKPA